VPNSFETKPISINDAGATTGWYTDPATHGFVRDASGNITTFDPPGSISTTGITIGPTGLIVGYWIDSSRAVHGFVRDAAGQIASFDVPNSSSTFTSGMKTGVITGFADVGGVQQGFVVHR
jgi:hypothetical protein